jgi:Trk K+ transport system NAD-binding subunit
MQFTWKETLSAGALLSARLSLIIAASAIGLQLGLISEEVNAVIILVAIITVTTAPIVFTRLFPKTEAVGPRPILVVGAGQFGLQVAEHLLAHGERVVVVDSDEGRTARAGKLGFETATGLVAPGDGPLTPYLDEAKTLVCAITDIEKKFRVCQVARTCFGIDRVMALLADPAESPRFTRLGVKTITLDLDWAAFIAVTARNPAAYELLTRIDDDKEMLEVRLWNPRLAGKQLNQLALPGDVRLLAIRRDGEILIPGAHTQLLSGDSISLVGTGDCIEEARRLLRGQIA